MNPLTPIFRHMEARGISLYAAAPLADLDPRMLQRWKAGTASPTVNNFYKLLRALEITPIFLYNGKSIEGGPDAPADFESKD